MEKKVIIVRYSEIHLKGRNKYIFINQLRNNIINALSDYNCEVKFESNRYIIQDIKKEEIKDIKTNLKKIFGIHSFSEAIAIDTSLEKIIEYIRGFKLSENTKSFAISVNRADKKFELSSPELEKQLGSIIYENHENIDVDLENPDEKIYLDIRESKVTYIYSNVIRGFGGMPVGSSGKALALLSGGIDSPVAMFGISNRGMQTDAIYFHTYPYTSEQAKQKVLDLAKIIKPYTGLRKVFVVPFTYLQEEINRAANPEFSIALMRRYMVRIAEKISNKHNYKALVTGENLAQVASQTIESLTSTQSALQSELLILRPLISSTKEDIIKKAKQIGTYSTSILPYEDCCTIFLPKNPIIKPKLKKVRIEESKLSGMDDLIQDA
ncbi:MAG: tRNA uracil 4-sulfurtransferase ThiI, partial [Candidatus Woesearchaeota archaeon]